MSIGTPMRDEKPPDSKGHFHIKRNHVLLIRAMHKGTPANVLQDLEEALQEGE